MPGTAGSFSPVHAFKRLRASQILHDVEEKERQEDIQEDRKQRTKERKERQKAIGKSSVFCKTEAI